MNGRKLREVGTRKNIGLKLNNGMILFLKFEVVSFDEC